LYPNLQLWLKKKKKTSSLRKLGKVKVLRGKQLDNLVNGKPERKKRRLNEEPKERELLISKHGCLRSYELKKSCCKLIYEPLNETSDPCPQGNDSQKGEEKEKELE
jgi:hypothetical protein